MDDSLELNGPAKPGRPTKRTPERRAKLLEAFRRGNPRSNACRLAGISVDLLRRWEADDETLAEEVGQAQAQMLDANIQVIQKAAEDDWKAAAWLAEKLCPEEFGAHAKPALPEPKPRRPLADHSELYRRLEEQEAARANEITVHPKD